MLHDVSRRHPRRFHLFTALALAALPALGLWALAGRAPAWPVPLACWLVTMNAVTFGYYGYDKAQARRGGRRVPEAVLHALAGLGGTPGALAAMRAFRHKTVDGPFRILFWCIVVLQAVFLAWVAKLLWRP